MNALNKLTLAILSLTIIAWDSASGQFYPDRSLELNSDEEFQAASTWPDEVGDWITASLRQRNNALRPLIGPVARGYSISNESAKVLFEQADSDTITIILSIENDWLPWQTTLIPKICYGEGPDMSRKKIPENCVELERIRGERASRPPGSGLDGPPEIPLDSAYAIHLWENWGSLSKNERMSSFFNSRSKSGPTSLNMIDSLAVFYIFDDSGTIQIIKKSVAETDSDIKLFLGYWRNNAEGINEEDRNPELTEALNRFPFTFKPILRVNPVFNDVTKRNERYEFFDLARPCPTYCRR